MYKKKKNSFLKVTCGILATLVLVGGIGTVTWGALTDWEFALPNNEDSLFDKVVIEDQSKVFTGEALTLDVSVPEGATYDVVIKDSEGSEIEEAIEIGTYTFEVTVHIGEESKLYVAILTITDSEVETGDIQEKGGMKLKLKSISTLDSGGVIKTFTYTITPSNATNQSVNVGVAWANDSDSSTDDDSFKTDKTVTDYLTISKDEGTKTITLTCKQAFASVIQATVTSVDNPEASAFVKVDYRKKRTYKINEVGSVITSTNSWSDLVEGVYEETVGTLNNNDPIYEIELKGNNMSGSLTSFLGDHEELKQAFEDGVGSSIVTEINNLEPNEYNEMINILNNFEKGQFTYSLSYADVLYELEPTFNLGLTDIKVTDIGTSIGNIEF